MAGKSFAADVDRIVINTEKRMTAVVRQSLQDVIEEAQTPGGKGGKGGKMRVDTGFLRASGQASLTGMPTGPVRGDPDKSYASPPNYSDTTSVNIALLNLKFGATFFFGWTANYAKYREAYDGFLESAVSKWPQIVNRNVEKVRQQIK